MLGGFPNWMCNLGQMIVIWMTQGSAVECALSLNGPGKIGPRDTGRGMPKRQWHETNVFEAFACLHSSLDHLSVVFVIAEQ